jgi:hypothetical protein
LLGVKQETDGVTIHDNGDLIAKYGRWTLTTKIANVSHTDINGPHRWYTAVGLRLSRTDDGLTFGTNHHKGITIRFVNRIPRVAGFKDHSMLWVSVADCEGLAAALQN